MVPYAASGSAARGLYACRRVGPLLVALAVLVGGAAFPSTTWSSVVQGSWVVIDTAPGGYHYDAPSASRTPTTNPHAGTHRGRSSPQTAARSSSRIGRFLAAKGARFVVDSAGETRVFVHAGEDAFEVSQHAALRITQRNLTVDQVEGVVNSAQPFRYFHGGAWKTGYYDPASRVFVGRGGNTITTVINNAKPQYIENPKAAQP